MFVFNHNKASYSWLSFHYMGALQPLPHSYKNSEHEVISNPGPVVTYSDAERETGSHLLQGPQRFLWTRRL